MKSIAAARAGCAMRYGHITTCGHRSWCSHVPSASTAATGERYYSSEARGGSGSLLHRVPCGASSSASLSHLASGSCGVNGLKRAWCSSPEYYSRRMQSNAFSPAASTPSTSPDTPAHADAAVGGNAVPATEGKVVVTFSPGSGVGSDGLVVPTTAITTHCDSIAESLSKADELALQLKAQASLGPGSEILTEESIQDMMVELKDATISEMSTMIDTMRQPGMIQRAGMHELRRLLFYSTALQARGWLDSQPYTVAMRMLTVELLRRDNEGVLAPSDVLYVSTQMIAANFYNRHLWNRMEKSMEKYSNFETIDLATIKALSTKLFKTRRGCPKETLDMRRKILSAMTRRVSVLANDFDLPSLLGILQCYSVHDMSPPMLEPLAIRATNHVAEFTPQECATLSHVLRKFRLMRLEVCERIIQRISTADTFNHQIANAALISIRTCFNKISDGGRNALHAEPMRQKLRALGEQIGCRLDEVEFPSIMVILSVLDIVVTLKIYVPKKALVSLFTQAKKMIDEVTGGEGMLLDPTTHTEVRPVTMEEGRQLQALLYHYGSDLCPELSTTLKEAIREGKLPDEASVD